MRVAIGAHELIPLQRNRDFDGRFYSIFGSVLLKAEHLTHATEIHYSVVSRCERNNVFDGTADLHFSRCHEQHTARTYVPGDSSFRDSFRSSADDFQR